MNRPESSTMSRSHILVQCLHCVCPGHLAVLLVHVVRTGTGVVANPDAEILDFLRTFLVDLSRPYSLAAYLDTSSYFSKISM